jgi:glycosyl transferase, family 25
LTRSGMDYEVITAIDERELDLRDHRIVHPSYLGRSEFRTGRVGNALSHLCVYRKILEDGLERGLVLEDDVTLVPELLEVVDALGNYLVGAEVALLNFDSREPCELSLEGLVHLPATRTLVLPIDISQPLSAAAYVITREACKRMSETVLPIRSNADDWNFWFSQGALDRVRCIVPLAVVKDPSFESTIEYHSSASLRARLLKVTTPYELPVIHRAIAYRRQRIWRKFTQVELVDKPFVAKPSRLE